MENLFVGLEQMHCVSSYTRPNRPLKHGMDPILDIFQ
jgi:hypothetical protein